MGGPGRRRIVVSATAAEAAETAAGLIARLLAAAAAARGRARLALAGGRTPEACYRLLAEEPHRGRIPWEALEVFWGDERCVPPEAPESNYRMAAQALLDRVPIPPGGVHRMRGELPPEAAAREYEEGLRRAFPGSGGPPRLDLLLLGLGPDAHTASLFPGTAALRERERWVAAARVEPLGWRLTLTPPMLNAAREVLFLVAGADKAEAVRAVLEGSRDPDRYPGQLVEPPDGRVTWLLDGPAASRLAATTAKG